MNGVGRAAREGCVRPNMLVEADVQTVRGIMEDPKCMWLQVDVGGGGWAPCDTPIVVDDGYVAAGALGELDVTAGGTGGRAVTPQVALPLRGIAQELGTLWSDDDDDGSGSEMDVGSSPLAARAGRRMVGSGRGRAGPLVEPVVLFPAVPIGQLGMRGLPRGGLSPTAWTGLSRNLARVLAVPPVAGLTKTLLVVEAAGLAGACARARQS